MKQKIDLAQASEGLALYAARRLVGFEQGRPGESCCRPETRHGWIRGIIQGMAEVCGQDAVPLLRAFDQRLDAASGSADMEPLPLNGQKYTVQNLRRYVSALGCMDGDQRARIFAVKKLLEDVSAYLPWDVGATGVYPAREETERALLRAVAQRPIRFTRVLLGGELDPGGVEYLPGMVNDVEAVRRTREFQRLTLEHPNREEWPALCIVCMGGGRQAESNTIDADGLDMAVIREYERKFMKRPEVCPVWMHELTVPVHEQLRMLKFEPGKAPEEVTMPNTLEAFQRAVGGHIKTLGLDSGAVLVCNEEGKLLGLSANRRVGGDTIAGTFLIAGSADGEFCSLSDEETARYAREFAQSISEPCPEGLKEMTFYIM
nr:DUF3846 domain-containing protein [uncultured Oscillibacter sp.]